MLGLPGVEPFWLKLAILDINGFRDAQGPAFAFGGEHLQL